MCKCNPSIRTPFCGRSSCIWPEDIFNKSKNIGYPGFMKEAFGNFTLETPFWCTGYDAVDHATICAAILANNVIDASTKIAESYDKNPHRIIFRFVEEKEKEWTPFGDRFPKADWMEWE